MIRLLKALIAFAIFLGTPAVAIAEGVLLTVSGSGAEWSYDRAALETLEQVEMVTTTIWTEGDQTFTGVPLSVLLSEAEVTEGTIKATAINDYAVSIPVDEVLGSDWPIVAYALNGEPMSVRDKGPLWIVYPFDADPTYRSEVIYSRSIWQLDRLVIEP